MGERIRICRGCHKPIPEKKRRDGSFVEWHAACQRKQYKMKNYSTFFRRKIKPSDVFD